MQSGAINGEYMETSLKKSCAGLQSIERTNQLRSRGKRHFIVKKEHADKLRHYVINTVIPDLEKKLITRHKWNSSRRCWKFNGTNNCG